MLKNKPPFLKHPAILVLLLLVLAITPGIGWGQVYYHDFGITAITAKPYTGPPTTLDPNLSGSSWTTSAAAFAGFAGNGGGTSACLSINNSSGTPTFTLTFNVATGYQLTVTSFNFWRVRSTSGAQNWSMTINGIAVGNGNIPATGAMIGQTNVSNPVSGLTGIITLVYTMSGASASGSCRLDDFTLNGSVISTGNTNPTVTTQAATSIATTTATGNGTITYTGGVDPSARGFCWDLASNPDPDINDSKVEETAGPYTTGTFTGSITGLTPGTKYKERAYATNTSGTGYGNIVIFYTLSTEPVSYPASFTASASSQSQINLVFSAASTISSASGYLIVQKSGSEPSNIPGDAMGYSVGTAIGDGTVAAIVTNSTATTAIIAGLTAGTHYYFKLFPFNWDGINAATYNYKTDLPVPTTDATTNPPNDVSSFVDAPGTQADPVSISSLSDTDPESVEVFKFRINDVGTDGLPTKVTQVTIHAGTNNSANWLNTIQGVKLSTSGGSSFVTTGAPVITASSIVFPISANNLNIINGGNTTVSLFLYLKSSGLTDNTLLEFKIPTSPHGFSADATGSTFLSSFSSATSSNQIYIDVVATKLNFIQQPTNVGTTPQTITPAVTVSADDANGNRDLNYISSFSITANGASLIGSPVSGNPVSGLATFSSLSFSAIAIGVTLEASSVTLAGATSAAFNVLSLPAPGEIVINQFSPDYSGPSNEYIELLNKTNKTFDLNDFKIEYQSASGGIGTAGGQLSGSLGPYQYWLLSPDATITIGQTIAVTRDGAIASGFAGTSGQLALRLKNSPNTIIDGLAYGTITTNNLGEGIAASSPPAHGGLVRAVDGSDNNMNSVDFTTVAQANIYLRNHNSYNYSTSYTLPSTNYSADVVISGLTTSVFLSGNTTIAGKLTILAGTLTIASDKNLTVYGTLTNSAGTAGLVVNSDLTGSGSLLHNTANVSGTIERYMTDANWADWTDGWHFLSSPVAAQDIGSFATFPAENYDFYSWYEPARIWVNYKNTGSEPTWNTANGSTSFTVGKGYMVAYNNAQVKSFSGILNVGSVAKTNLPFTPLSYTGSDIDPGWNMLGNPFASAITWKTPGWTLQNIAAVSKIWNEGMASYTDIDSGMIIPATQGFMVNAISITNSLTIPAASRTHSTQPWYKSTGNPYLRLVAKNLDAKTAQESVVTFCNEATPGYDPGFDSHFLPGYAPLFYSVDGTEKLSTNVLPAPGNQTTIPFNFIKTTGTHFTIEAVQMANISAQVYLTDLNINKIQNLRENPVYAFTASQGDNPSRFLISFSHVGIPEITSGNNGIYSYKNNLYLVNPGLAKLDVFNLTGQKILTEEINSSGLHKTIIIGPDGFYLVRLTTKTRIVNTKVFITL